VVVELGGMGWRYIEVELGICHRSLEGFASGDIVRSALLSALAVCSRAVPCRAPAGPGHVLCCVL
jgi:hypothetical protein